MKKNISTKPRRSRKGEGYLYKRSTDGSIHPPDWNGKGRFYLAYRTGAAGKRKLVRVPLRNERGAPITTKAEAEAERLRIMAPVQAGAEVETLKARLVKAEGEQAEAIKKSRGDTPLADAWRKFTAFNPRKPKDSTLQQYAVQWNMFHRWMRENYPANETLESIRRGHVREYWNFLAASGTSQGTRNKHKNLLSMVFRTVFRRKAQDEEDALKDTGADAEITPDKNPWEIIDSGEHVQHIRSDFTPEQLRRIIGTAEGELRILYCILLYSGLRLGDAATLLWQEVDFSSNCIRRIPSKTSKRGKAVEIPMKPELSAIMAEARKIAQGEYVAPALAELYNRRGSDAITKKIQAHLWSCGIDCHAKGTGQQLKRDALGNHVTDANGKPVLIATGVRAVVEHGAHSFRHSFVSLCRESNVPLKVIEELVGHASPMMTRRYTHTAHEEAARAVAMIPDFLSPTTGDGAAQQRTPAPQWVITLAKSMTAKNWKQIKEEILKGVNA